MSDEERRFTKYELRTTDPDAAHAFYLDALGLDVRAMPGLALSLLPERARANGAPAHWLGHIGVDDVDAVVERFVALGAQTVGPPQERDGSRWVILRDPLGAIVAVSSTMNTPSPSVVAWHHLHTTDRERAFGAYRALFGWIAREEWMGEHRTFSWSGHGNGHENAQGAEGPVVGGVADSARRPGVHTHWLFYFAVPDLVVAMAKVRAGGGLVLSPVELPTGQRLVACEDPQGAAFGLSAT